MARDPERRPEIAGPAQGVDPVVIPIHACVGHVRIALQVRRARAREWESPQCVPLPLGRHLRRSPRRTRRVGSGFTLALSPV